MKRIYTLFGFSLLSISAVIGQTQAQSLPNHRDGETVEYCTQHHQQELLLSDPAAAAQFNAAQAELAAREAQMAATGTTRGTVYTIPVVFHVLHQGGDENISREQILDALAILNRDYRLLNADANTVHIDFNLSNPAATCVPTDVEIEFVLATKAPNGACFGGITRTFSATTNDLSGSSDGINGQSQVAAIVAGNDVYQGTWPTNKYLNVIIAKGISGAAGYTYNPGSGNGMNYNSIWMLSHYTGSIGTSEPSRSRALTHEVGHWLNLSHTWGGNNNPGEACGSDGVADTPQTRGVTGCSLNENFCGPRANVENYMDYSYCSKMFSAGQVARMRAAITSSTSGRNNIWKPANLTEVGADGTAGLCAASFNADKTAICAGEQITFTDESYNSVTGWNWSFPGGTPSTSTDQNPVVTYTTPGTYQVILTATDGSTSDPEQKDNYITVLPTSASLPFVEGFEDLGSFTGSRWIISNPGSNAAWSVFSGAGSGGSKSAKLANYNQAADNVDEMISFPVDLSEITEEDGVTLSFRYAYRKRMASNDDFLKVFLSKDCGDTWDVRKTMSAASMSTVTQSGDWVPSPADWETVHMTNVTSLFWVENFRFKFRLESGSGNNLYIDDINIYEGDPSNTVVVGLDEIAELQNAIVYPNPADNEVNVRFSSATSQEVTLTITDLTGKILQERIINAAEGSNLVMMSTTDMASGMYLVRLNGGSQTLSFVVR